MAERIKVAVRVRPLNSAEKTDKNSTICVDIHGKTVTLSEVRCYPVTAQLLLAHLIRID